MSRRDNSIPHDLVAEESLLGAMMLSRDAIVAALDITGAEDLYKPAHVKMFQAIERLYVEEAPVDPVTLAAELDLVGALQEVGGRKELLRIQTETPASANARHYARIVRDLATCRRAIERADALRALGYERDLDGISGFVDELGRVLEGPLPRGESFTMDELVAIADADDVNPAKPWLIPGLFRVMETLVLTGGEGHGKATLLRQIAACVACGIHPLLGTTDGMIEPQRVLYVDLQEDTIDAAHELRRLRRAARHNHVPGMLRYVTRPAGVNLATPHGQRWLEGYLDEHRPSLVLMGPIVRMYAARGKESRYSEELVDEVTDFLDKMRQRYQFGLMLEGHAGNDREGDDAWRVRGSSVWRSWPAFGLGLKPIRSHPVREAGIVFWRGARHAGRPWPSALYGRGRWPWSLSTADFEALAKHLNVEHILPGYEGQQSLGDGEPF